MDLHLISQLGGVVAGQVLHIIKKKTEEDSTASESSIFTKWVMKKPANTIAASLLGMGAAVGLDPSQTATVAATTGDLFHSFVAAVLVGISSNSIVNRAEK